MTNFRCLKCSKSMNLLDFPKWKRWQLPVFSKTSTFFLIFEKKTFFFMKIVRFCQKPKAMRFFIFCAKNKKDVLGTESVTKFRKFAVNSRENQANSWVSGLGINVNVFFTFFIFRKVIDNEMVFWKILPTNARKSVLNWSKSSRFKHSEHV